MHLTVLDIVLAGVVIQSCMQSIAHFLGAKNESCMKRICDVDLFVVLFLKHKKAIKKPKTRNRVRTQINLCVPTQENNKTHTL